MDVLDAADLDAGARKRAESRLRAGSRALRLRAADGTELDVNSADVQLLEPRRDILDGSGVYSSQIRARC